METQGRNVENPIAVLRRHSEKVQELLEKQMDLLADASKTADNDELAELSNALGYIASILLTRQML